MIKQWLTPQEVADLGVIYDTTGKLAKYWYIRKLVMDGRLKSQNWARPNAKNPRWVIKRAWISDYVNKYQV